MGSQSIKKRCRCIQLTSLPWHRSIFFHYSICSWENLIYFSRPPGNFYKFRMNSVGKMITFNNLLNKWDWQPIPNCPGRNVLKGGPQKLSIHDIFGRKVDVFEFETPKARDIVLAFALSGGGIISYKKKDGAYLHTLCDEEGFKRKLEQLEI